MINNESPKFDNVLWVRGLTSNLISISQLCEQGMNVNFTNSECLVTNENGEILMIGIKIEEKCYEWVPHLEGKNVQQTRMLQTMLKHQQNSEEHDLSQCGSIDDWRGSSRMNSF